MFQPLASSHKNTKMLSAIFVTLIIINCTKIRTVPEHGDPIANAPKIETGDFWVEEMDGDIFQIRVLSVSNEKNFVVERKSQSTGIINRIYFDESFKVIKTEPMTLARGNIDNRFRISIINRSFLSFPLFVGKSWEERVSEGGPDAEIKYVVEGFEEIKVPAGKMKAFKISATHTHARVGSLEDIYWYSPEAKYFVKKNPLGTIKGELLSFRHTGRSPTVEYFSGTVLYLKDPQSTKIEDVPAATFYPPDAKAAKPNTYWAILIGISNYQDSRIPSLRYAAEDSMALYEWLVSAEGGKHAPSRVKLLNNELATGAAIKAALFEWLRQAIAEDVVIIYFSGHGSSDSPDSKDNLFLLPYDADYDSIATTGFPMWDIETALKRFIKAKKVVVIADACHAGGVGKPFDISRKAGGRGVAVTPISSTLQTLSTVNDGICIISASDDNQFSQEGAEWGGGHGVFTHFLLQGLAGEADYNQDGIVKLGEIIPYLSENVRRATKNAQAPTVAGKFDPALSLSK